MERAAGIVLVRFIRDEPHILCLRIYGSYDLPKGKIEQGEDAFEAALRETSEEASVTDVDFPWGKETFRSRNGNKKEVILFLGMTDQEPALRPNPTTGKYEHHGCEWLTLDRAETGLHPYLRSVVPWVRHALSVERAVKALVSGV